jgi:uncharacterized membrane protein
MKQYKTVILLCFVLFAIVSPSAKAVGLDYYRIESVINEDNTVDNTIGIEFDSPIYHLDYILDFKIYDFNVTGEFDAFCEVNSAGKETVISCDFVGMTRDNNLVTMTFQTRDVVKRMGDSMQYVINYPVAFDIKKALIVVKLPPNAALSEESINQSIFPQNGEITTDGKSIIVFWNMKDIEPGNNLQFSVSYNLPVARGPFFEAIIVGSTLLIILTMIGMAFYMKKTPSREQTDTANKIVSSILNQDEKKIIEALKNHEGNMIQRVIVRETEFSKAKVSRLIKNLKERNLVDVEPLGRKNRVKLKMQMPEKTE